MPLAAANANQQTGALQRFITEKSKDGVVNLPDVEAILALAKKEDVQGGELALLRQLAGRQALTPRAKDWFVRQVDAVVPAGAPTAQMAAILFRIDPATGRQQLLKLLDESRNPVAGGPKTFVVRGLGPPYLAAITTGQVITGLTKFLDGASPADAARIRGYLSQQLQVLQRPVSRGGLAVPGMVAAPRGLALSDDTRAGGIIAVNQSAVVLRSLERIALLPGAENAKLAADARAVGTRMARELKAELDFTYPATGRLAYSLRMRSGRAEAVRLEDGDHLKTTLDALKSLQVFGARFEPVLERIAKRLPEIGVAGPEDLDGRAGHVYTDGFNAFRAEYQRVIGDGVATATELQRLDSLGRRDGLLTPGERALIRRARAV